MSPAQAAALILAIHVVVIGFNVLGLFAIPLGAQLGWRWVRVRWWRALHLLSWATVAVQATLGRACFLTSWEDRLLGVQGQPPLIQRLVDRLIYWPLPIWAFSAIYLVMFAAVVVLWWIAPPARVKARP